MPVTPLLAAIFTIIYLVLSLAVVRQRIGTKIGLGTGADRELEKAIRIHGNFAEYVPLSLLLLWFLETITYSSSLALMLGCVLLIARIAHVIGMRDPANFIILRQLGVLGTFGVLLVSAASLIWHYLPF